jgi:hypothetical protein
MSRFEQTKTQQMHSGVVFSEYAVVLPKEVSFYHTHTGAVSRVSATELVHMGPFDHLYTHPKDSRGPVMSLQCLSVSGEWQFRDTNPAHLRSGNPRSV